MNSSKQHEEIKHKLNTEVKKQHVQKKRVHRNASKNAVPHGPKHQDAKKTYANEKEQEEFDKEEYNAFNLKDDDDIVVVSATVLPDPHFKASVNLGPEKVEVTEKDVNILSKEEMKESLRHEINEGLSKPEDEQIDLIQSEDFEDQYKNGTSKNMTATHGKFEDLKFQLIQDKKIDEENKVFR